MKMKKFSSMFNFCENGTLGTEEEIWLIDEKGKLSPRSLDVLRLAGQQISVNGKWMDKNGSINSYGESSLQKIKSDLNLQPELPAQQVEITSGKQKNVAALIENLGLKRKWLADTAKKIDQKLLFDPAPNVTNEDLIVFPRKRYKSILEDKKGQVLDGFIAALHVHYGVRNQESAIRVLNHASENIFSIFKFAYSEKRIEKYARMAGKENLVPPQFKNWEDYFLFMEKERKTDDPTMCWWMVRINPIGTVELRIADISEDLEKTKRVIEMFTSIAEEAL